DSRTTRIDVWTRQGRALSTDGWRNKRWGHREGRLIQDLVVTSDGTRVFMVQEGARAQMTVVALRPDGKQLWKRRHGRSEDSSYYGVYLLPAEDRERVLVVGADV